MADDAPVYLRSQDYSLLVRGHGVDPSMVEGVSITVPGVKHYDDLKSRLTGHLQLETQPVTSVALWMQDYDEWVGLSWDLSELTPKEPSTPAHISAAAKQLVFCYGGAPPPDGAEPEPESEPRARFMNQAAAMNLGAPPMGMAGQPQRAVPAPAPAQQAMPQQPMGPEMPPAEVQKLLRTAIRKIQTIPEQIRQEPARLVPLLMEKVQRRQLDSLKIIIQEGDDGAAEMFLLVQGSVEVMEGTNIKAKLDAPTSFGEKCIGDPHGGVRTATIRAATPVLLLVLNSDAFATSLSALGTSFAVAQAGSVRGRTTSSYGLAMDAVQQQQQQMGMAQQPQPGMMGGPPQMQGGMGGGMGPIWQRPGRLQCAVAFTEPAKGQEAKFSKSCQGYANFTGQNQGAMDAVRPRSLPPWLAFAQLSLARLRAFAQKGQLRQGLGFSVEMHLTQSKVQTWQGIVAPAASPGQGNVLLATQGMLAQGGVQGTPDGTGMQMQLVLQYTLADPERLRTLAKGSEAQLAKLKKQSEARAGKYVCKILVKAPP